jgi:Predicted transcriptional regulators
MYETFKKLLEDRGVTPAQVARETGLSNTLFSEWKRGKAKPKMDKLNKIAKYFGVPLETFLEPEND